jgi:hypothetical protein
VKSLYIFYELCISFLFSTNFMFPVHREVVTLNNWPSLQENADIIMDSFPAVSLPVVVNSCDSGSLYVREDPQNCSYWK